MLLDTAQPQGSLVLSAINVTYAGRYTQLTCMADESDRLHIDSRKAQQSGTSLCTAMQTCLAHAANLLCLRLRLNI